MENTASRVGLVKGADRRSNVYGSMELVRADIEAKVREQVLLKPNFLSSENQLASTHADAMRGPLISFYRFHARLMKLSLPKGVMRSTREKPLIISVIEPCQMNTISPFAWLI